MVHIVELCSLAVKCPVMHVRRVISPLGLSFGVLSVSNPNQTGPSTGYPHSGQYHGLRAGHASHTPSTTSGRGIHQVPVADHSAVTPFWTVPSPVAMDVSSALRRAVHDPVVTDRGNSSESVVRGFPGCRTRV